MAGLNKVLLIGRLGKDPETRYTQSGLAVASFNVATSEKFKKQNGETDERTEWHKCTAFGKQAETIEKYLKKGSQVYIEGRLQTDEYEKDGVTRYTTKVIVSGFQFLDSKGSQPHGGQPQAQNSAPVVSDDEIPF
ncbi:single-stranded DNA-binding protein [Desulfobacter postgatei]|uniref:single-stranded DNA-binding protein n=1 Tax=Desulfobacter postgatei TaxID=2293 RepID=UPI002FD9EF1B